MRRRRSGSPFSLFSFQDAITSVCGVIVLITLLMALDLTRRATEETAPSAVARERVEETERRIEELRNNLSSVQATLDATAHIDEAALGMTIEEGVHSVAVSEAIIKSVTPVQEGQPPVPKWVHVAEV